MFIAIEGNIGAGKTTLAKLLANKLNAHLMLEEFSENVFLPQFYKEPERFAFPVELSFLADRYHQLSRLPGHQPIVVSDYFLYKSLIFAEKNLQKNELELFMRLFTIMFQSVPKPDKLIYLDVSNPALQERIASRGRLYEQTIPDTYLTDINQGYMEYLSLQKEFIAIHVNAEKRDFVNNASDFAWLMKQLMQHYPKGTHVLE